MIFILIELIVIRFFLLMIKGKIVCIVGLKNEVE